VIFCRIGVIVAGSVFWYKIVGNFRMMKRMKVKFKNLEFKDSGLWFNTSGAIVALALLIYVFFSEPDVAAIKRGSVRLCGVLVYEAF
jgi:hypothetical protein